MVEGGWAASALVESRGDLYWIRPFGLDAWGLVSMGLAVCRFFSGATLARGPLAGGLLGDRHDRRGIVDRETAGLPSRRDFHGRKHLRRTSAQMDARGRI